MVCLFGFVCRPNDHVGLFGVWTSAVPQDLKETLTGLWYDPNMYLRQQKTRRSQWLSVILLAVLCHHDRAKKEEIPTMSKAPAIAGTLQTDPRSGGVKKSSGVKVLPIVAEGASFYNISLRDDLIPCFCMYHEVRHYKIIPIALSLFFFST